MALKDVLKKIGGVVTGVASTLIGNNSLVGTALSNVSNKLLASPTPQKDSATALIQSLVTKPKPSATSTAPENPVQTQLQALPQKQIAAIAALPPQPPATSAIKDSSIALQIGEITGTPLQPVSNTIKASSYTLVGETPSQANGQPYTQVPSEISLRTSLDASKSATQIFDDLKTPGERKQQVSTLAIIVGAAVFIVVAIIAVVFGKKKRR